MSVRTGGSHDCDTPVSQQHCPAVSEADRKVGAAHLEGNRCLPSFLVRMSALRACNY